MERVNDTFLLLGRILIATLFLNVGIPKALQGYGGGFAQNLASMGVPYADIVAVVAVAVEVLVPIAMILGVFPRISALLLIAFTVVATGLAHRYWEFAAGPQQTAQMYNFFKNVGIVGGLLCYFVSGPGAFSLAGRSAAVGTPAPARA
jgi:putative oxidoreductase